MNCSADTATLTLDRPAFTPTRNLEGSFVSLTGSSVPVEGARPAEDGAHFADFDGEFSGV